MHPPRIGDPVISRALRPWYTPAVALCFLHMVLLALVAGPALGQTPAEPDDSAGEATAEAVEAPYVVPTEHLSAQATMRTFLEAFDPAKRSSDENPLDIAAACLDLSEIDPELRTRLGRERARELKEVLDRTALIDIDSLPDVHDAEPWRLAIAPGDDGAVGDVVIAADARGEWLFTAETVARTPEFLRALDAEEVVEGVTEALPMTPAMWLRGQMSPQMRERSFLLEYWQWAGLMALLLVGMILDRLLTWLLRGAIERHLAKRMETVDGDQLKHSLRPMGLLIAALFWWLALFWLGLPPSVLQVLVLASKFVAAVAAVTAIYRLIDVVASLLAARAEATQGKFDDLLVPLFRKSTKVFVTAFGLVFIAETLKLPIGSIIAGLGVGGLAIALAAQDTVKNFFGSLTVILDRPFAVGDWVQIGDVEGTVHELGFRSTRIRTFYDSIVTVPNANLISATVDNYGLRRYRRWSTKLSITYDTPAERIEAFCEGVRELIRQHPGTRKDYFEVHLNTFESSSLDVLLYVFFAVPDWSAELRARHQLAVDIIRLAENLGVDFAFPTQTLYLQRPGSGDILAPEGYAERIHENHRLGQETARALSEGSGTKKV